jgi:hypothetical protein
MEGAQAKRLERGGSCHDVALGTTGQGDETGDIERQHLSTTLPTYLTYPLPLLLQLCLNLLPPPHFSFDACHLLHRP